MLRSTLLHGLVAISIVAGCGSDANENGASDGGSGGANENPEGAPGSKPPPTNLYASPNGSGATCTEADPCSLVGARDRARTLTPSMKSDIVVNLLAGTYALDATFVLSPDAGDSGRNGNMVVYRAAGFGTASPAAVTISGGRTVSGFTMHDAAKKIWKADVGDLVTRQLFVNGKRARRARRNAGIPGVVTETDKGYVTTSAEPLAWAGATHADVVYHDGDKTGNWLWVEPRCPIVNVTPSGAGAFVEIARSCFLMAHGGRSGLTLPTFVEHVMPALVEPGTFYLDTSKAGAHVLYVIPRDGEELASAEVVAPVLEQLVKGDGRLDAPLENIALKGLTFADTTWMRPSTERGFNETSYNKFSNPPPEKEGQIGAAVWFYASHGIRIEDAKFVRLGGAGITFDNGSQNDVVVGSEFTDISGNGVQIGNVDISAHEGPALVTDNRVENCYFHDIGVEYPGAYGVWNANTQNTTVTHSTFAHLPRGGFASNYVYQGGATVASGHQFTYNLVFDYMNGVRDGGGFDTNGMQNGVDGAHPGSVLRGNVFHGDHERYGQIYLDFWSAGMTLENNVAFDSVTNHYNTLPTPQGPCCNVVRQNFYDKDVAYKYQPNVDMVIDDHVLPVDAMPMSILERAGLEPKYRHLLPPPAAKGDTTAPSAPPNARGVSNDPGPSATVAWDAATDDVGVTGYEVDAGERVLAAVTGNVRAARLEGLTPGTTTTAVVRARDKAGNLSPPSQPITIVIPGDPHLLGHWTFDDGFADASGALNAGAASNTGLVAGRIGGAASFDGVRSTVDVGNAQLLNLDRKDFTLAVWLRASGAGFKRIVTKGNFGDTPGYLLNYDSGAITFGIGANSVKENAVIVSTPGTFGDGQWHHVAAVADRKGLRMMIYVDGKRVALRSGFCGKSLGDVVSLEGCPFPAASSNDPLTIGSYRGVAEFFAGALDDLRIYDRVLADPEIAALAK